jgi:hypothetical protein
MCTSAAPTASENRDDPIANEYDERNEPVSESTHHVHRTSLGHTARRAASSVPTSAQAHSHMHEAARAQPETDDRRRDEEVVRPCRE